MKQSAVIGLILVVTLGLQAANCEAQWKAVAPNVLGNLGYGAKGMITKVNGTLWAGNYSLLKSNDQGASWSIQAFPLPPMSAIMDIEFLDQFNGLVTTYGSNQSAVFKTSDGGTSWTKIFGQYAISACFGGGSSEIVVTGFSVSISRDGGMSWIPQSALTNALGLSRTGGGLYLVSMINNSFPDHLFRSDDGGFSWSQTTGETPLDCYTIMYNACHDRIVLVNESATQGPAPYNANNIVISTDFGSSWIIAYHNSVTPHVAGGLACGARAIYCPTVSEGILRSLDLGATWQSISGPNTARDSRSIVAIDDNTLVAFDTGGTIWRTTNSGGHPVRFSTSGNYELQPPSLFASDSLSRCDSPLVRFAWLATPPCKNGNVVQSITGPDADHFRLVQPMTSNLSGYDSVGIAFKADSVRDYHATYELDIDGTTSLTISLIGHGRQETRFLSQDSALDFSATSACATQPAAAFIFSSSCSPWRITSASLSGPDSSNFELRTTLPILLTGRDSLHLLFKPDTIRPYTAILHVTLDDGTIRNIALRGSAKDPGALIELRPASLFATDSASKCDPPVLRSLLISDTACVTHNVLGSSITGADSNEYKIIYSPKQLPDSAIIEFLPKRKGNTSATLQLLMSDSTVVSVPLYGTGAQGQGILNVASKSISAGSLQLCAGDTTLSSSISNTGCDTLRIMNIRFAGDATLSYLSSTNDTLLVPDSSKRFSFYFAPRTAGVHSGTLTFHSANLHGNDPGHDTTITISGTGIPSTPALSVPSTRVTLPQLIAGCTAASDTIWLFDSLCADQKLTIDSTRVESAAPGTLTLPIIASSILDFQIGNHDSIGIIVSFYPTSADTGASTSLIRVFYHGEDGVRHDTTVLVSASAVPPAKIQFHLGQGVAATALHSATSGLVNIPIYVRTPSPLSAITSADITSLDLRVWFNTDLITPVSLTVVGQRYDVDVQYGTRTPLQYQLDGAFLHIPLPQGFTMSSDSLVATLTCQTFVTDTVQTRIWLDPVSISAQANESACLGVSSDTSSAMFTLDPVCPDNMLSGFVGTHTFEIESIVPNPARDEIAVGVRGIGDGVSGIAVFDLLGDQVLTRSSSVTGSNGFTLDTSHLPKGSYYLRLSSGNAVATRQFVIRR